LSGKSIDNDNLSTAYQGTYPAKAGILPAGDPEKRMRKGAQVYAEDYQFDKEKLNDKRQINWNMNWIYLIMIQLIPQKAKTRNN
jgi:hypothetical protein